MENNTFTKQIKAIQWNGSNIKEVCDLIKSYISDPYHNYRRHAEINFNYEGDESSTKFDVILTLNSVPLVNGSWVVCDHRIEVLSNDEFKIKYNK